MIDSRRLASALSLALALMRSFYESGKFETFVGVGMIHLVCYGVRRRCSSLC
jgi:hypothetical protein